MIDEVLERPDGRTVGYTDSQGGGTPVLWCNGGPGSRLEAVGMAPAAGDAGYRLIGLDRPGYGRSTPWPGRTIADGVPDALAVLDRLGVDRVAVVGVSTGGAHALALAAAAPERVLGVVACCALTDMRWDEGKAMMDDPGIVAIWSAPDRDAALAFAVEQLGENGERMLDPDPDATPQLPPSDMATLADPQFLAGLAPNLQASFAQGVGGYVDDRLADGPGWGTFDVTAVRCPVTVLHGGADPIVPVAQAHHTASIVPGATLQIVDDRGHFSIIGEVVAALSTTLGR
jgi:pimeloyl-ACP methyl ester carboxylesterase